MTTINITTESPATAAIIVQIMMEVERAEGKHPIWPNDIIRQIAFVSEEAGELTRAGNLLEEGEGSFQDIRTEAIQTASTAIRLLKQLHDTEINHIRHYYIAPVDFEISDEESERIRKEVENG